MELNPSIDPETQYFRSYSEEEDGDSCEKSTKMGYVLDKGLSLGKKLVVTGFVVSSVPLLLPPLLVVSALGFTFSLPFGFIYASYACTEKLMSKLLPTQVMIDSANVPLLLEGDSGPEELKNTAAFEEMRGLEDVEEDEKDSLPVVEVKDDELIEEESEKHVASGESVGAENPEDPEKKHQDDIRGDVTGLEETEKGGKRRIWGKLKPSRKRKAQSGGDKKVHNFLQESKSSSSDIVSPEVVAEENTANERMETSREEEQAVARDFIKSKGTVTDEESLESSTAVGEVEVAEEGKKEKQEEKTSELKASSENNEQSKMVLSDDNKHSLNEAALVDMPVLKNEEAHHLEGDRIVSDAESAEGSSENENIWRKIDLIRAIVGFKTPRHPSYLEELRELYAFTGIEWPPLAKDPSELTELNNKLHFLMSVIGVK